MQDDPKGARHHDEDQSEDPGRMKLNEDTPEVEGHGLRGPDGARRTGDAERRYEPSE